MKFIELEALVTKYPYAKYAWNELKASRDTNARVYHTYISGGAEDHPDDTFEFVTPSKDLHLSFSRLTGAGQYFLAKFLQEQFEICHEDELLVAFELAGKACLVTFSAKRGITPLGQARSHTPYRFCFMPTV